MFTKFNLFYDTYHYVVQNKCIVTMIIFFSKSFINTSILNMNISYKTPLLVMYKYKSHWDTKMYKMQRKYFETILTQIVLHAQCRQAKSNYSK